MQSSHLASFYSIASSLRVYLVLCHFLSSFFYVHLAPHFPARTTPSSTAVKAVNTHSAVTFVVLVVVVVASASQPRQTLLPFSSVAHSSRAPVIDTRRELKRVRRRYKEKGHFCCLSLYLIHAVTQYLGCLYLKAALGAVVYDVVR
jgi:hypothetical protein